MEFYGYGYRKNCFGESVFFEDSFYCYNRETIKKTLEKALKKTYDMWAFSFKAVSEKGETWAVSMEGVNDWENKEFTVIYSRAWNSTDAPKKMKKAAIIKEIMAGLPE